jgi:pullulanase
VVQYVEDLIRLRRQHPAFRMYTGAQIAEYLRFDEHTPAGTIAYTLNGAAMNDSWKKIWVGFNGRVRRLTQRRDTAGGVQRGSTLFRVMKMV